MVHTLQFLFSTAARDNIFVVGVLDVWPVNDACSPLVYFVKGFAMVGIKVFLGFWCVGQGVVATPDCSIKMFPVTRVPHS